MKHKFSTLLYISENSSKIIFKTDLTFYLGFKLSLEYFVNHQNSLIGWIRVKWRSTFIAYEWFLPKIHTETSAFFLNQDCFWLNLWKVQYVRTTRLTRKMKKSFEKCKLYWKNNTFFFPGYSPFCRLKFCLLKRFKNKILCGSIINGPKCD